MSNMKPQGPLAKGGFMGASSDPIRKNMSLFNPTDQAAMIQSGTFTPDMPLGEMMTNLGFDLNAPGLPQLKAFADKQLQNGDMVGKMQNIAKDSQQGQPPAPPVKDQEQAGLSGLMGM